MCNNKLYLNFVVAAGGDTPVVRTPGGSPDSSSPDDKDKKLQSQQSTDSDKNSPTQVHRGL